MSRAHRFPVTALVLVASVPFAWLACGGGGEDTKPPETPSSDTSASASSEAPEADSASAAASATAEAPAAASTEAPAPAAPPPPTFGSTDCGACVDKACAKPEAACGKNTDCQSMLDSIHSCTSGGASCIDGATAPTAAKPKKLAGMVETCAKKAIAGKTCKAKCQ